MKRTRLRGGPGWKWLRLAACVALVVAGFVSSARPQTPPESESFRISVDVDLVLLHATVRDRKGRFVTDLRKEDFQVYEDRASQSIRLFRQEDVPVTVGLVVDHSGSMGRKLRDVVDAARTFVQFSNPQDEMFVINFNDTVTAGLPEAIKFTNQSDELERAISNAATTGRTALYDAIAEALIRVRTGSRDKKVLLVISDGGDNASTRTLAQILAMAGESGTLVYTVGIFDEEDPDKNPGVLRRLARETGGEAFIPGRSEPLTSVCERIARDIRHQYTIGYTSTNQAQPGTYRAVKVTAAAEGRGKLSVRTRTGYIARDVPRSGTER